MKAITRSTLDQLKVYALSAQVGIREKNTQAIIRTIRIKPNNLEVGIERHGVSLTTEPFSNGLNASIKVSKCWLL